MKTNENILPFFWCLFYLVYHPISFGETLQTSSMRVYFYFFFLAIVRGSEHIAHEVLKSLWTADRYLGNALRIKRWNCGKYPFPLNITFSSFTASIAEEREYTSPKSPRTSYWGTIHVFLWFELLTSTRQKEKERLEKNTEENKHYTCLVPFDPWACMVCPSPWGFGNTFGDI